MRMPAASATAPRSPRPSQEECFWQLDGPVVRIAGKNTPIPTSPALEDAAVPQLPEIISTLRRGGDDVSAHDVVVLGGGPGGYAAALYGASAGLDVALVEEQKLGGTCLHRGCIPAKALLHAAEVARTVGEAGDFGIMPDGGFRPDWTQINERKSGIVDRLCRGLTGLLGQRKVTVVNGRGCLTPDGAVAVDGTVLTGRGVIIATGSEPRSLPGYEFDGESIISSDHATNLPSLGQRAGGHRRRRGRLRVHVGLRRPRRHDHAAGNAARRGAAR